MSNPLLTGTSQLRVALWPALWVAIALLGLAVAHTSSHPVLTYAESAVVLAGVGLKYAMRHRSLRKSPSFPH